MNSTYQLSHAGQPFAMMVNAPGMSYAQAQSAALRHLEAGTLFIQPSVNPAAVAGLIEDCTIALAP
jgi:hypothetical protein